MNLLPGIFFGSLFNVFQGWLKLFLLSEFCKLIYYYFMIRKILKIRALDILVNSSISACAIFKPFLSQPCVLLLLYFLASFPRFTYSSSFLNINFPYFPLSPSI